MNTATFTRAGLLLGLRSMGVLLQVAVQAAVGAIAGAGALGLLQTTQTWAATLGETLARGAPTIVMRRCSAGDGLAEQNAFIRQQLDASARLWLRLLVPAGLVATWLWVTSGAAEGLLAAGIGLVLAIFFAASRTRCDALRGLGSAAAATAAESVLAPAVLLGALFLVDSTSPISITACYGLGLVATWMLSSRLLPGHGKTQRASRGRLGSEQRALWGVAIVNMAFVGLPFLVWSPFADLAAVGAFALAYKLVNIITTVLLTLAGLFGPRFSHAWSSGDREVLRREFRRSQVLSMVCYVPTMTAVIALAPWLSNALGGEFDNLRQLTLILACGYLINAATGLCGLVLNMSGNGRREYRASLAWLAATAAATLLLSPNASEMAALFSCAVAGKNLTSWALARAVLRHPCVALVETRNPV